MMAGKDKLFFLNFPFSWKEISFALNLKCLLNTYAMRYNSVGI